MMEALLKRIRQNDRQTQGILLVYDQEGNLHCALNTIELPWRENKKEISCVPRGTYKVMARNSEKYGEHYILESVPNRSLILIHTGNYHDNTLGCILPGLGFGDIDGDGYLDVVASRHAMQKLFNAIGKNPFLLTIQGVT